MSKFLFPLLQDKYEDVLSASIKDLRSIEEADEMSRISDSLSPEVVRWPLSSIGSTQKITGADFVAFRTRLMNKVRNEGIDLQVKSELNSRAAFDRVVIEFFSDYFCNRGKEWWVSPAEAADPQMWKYINCFVIPDLVYWRWGNTMDRYLGARRSYSYNMWVRAYYFRELPCYAQLNEDIYQAIVERTTLMTYSNVVPILAEKMTKIGDRKKYRDLASAVLAMCKNIDLLSKSDQEIREFIDRISK